MVHRRNTPLAAPFAAIVDFNQPGLAAKFRQPEQSLFNLVKS
jgi:hypothetical protein